MAYLVRKDLFVTPENFDIPVTDRLLVLEEER